MAALLDVEMIRMIIFLMLSSLERLPKWLACPGGDSSVRVVEGEISWYMQNAACTCSLVKALWYNKRGRVFCKWRRFIIRFLNLAVCCRSSQITSGWATISGSAFLSMKIALTSWQDHVSRWSDGRMQRNHFVITRIENHQAKKVIRIKRLTEYNCKYT